MYLHYTPDRDFVLGISDLAANESTFSPPLKSYPLEVNRLLRLELSTDHAWSLRGTPPLLTFHLRSKSKKANESNVNKNAELTCQNKFRLKEIHKNKLNKQRDLYMHR